MLIKYLTDNIEQTVSVIVVAIVVSVFLFAGVIIVWIGKGGSL